MTRAAHVIPSVSEGPGDRVGARSACLGYRTQFLAALLVILAVACANPASRSGGAAPASGADSSATTTANPSTAPQETTTMGPRVTFPNGFVVRVELATDDAMRAQGLMYRDRLDPDAGMLFLFPADEPLRFWMKNTRIPLDMIFLDAGRRIVDIQRNVPPCKFDPCPSYGPGASVLSRYVLEIGGGEAARHSLKNGDVLTFEGTEDVAIE